MITPKQVLDESYEKTMRDMLKENNELKALDNLEIERLQKVYKAIPLSRETNNYLSILLSEIKFLQYERFMANRLGKQLEARLKRQKYGSSNWDIQFEKAANIPIESIVRTFNRTGNLRYNINCPLHKDKSPSFSCSTKKDVWHCFSCGEGGKPIQLIMKMHNMNFKEAVYFINENFYD